MAEHPVIAELREWRKHICKPDGTCVFWGRIYNDVFHRFPDGHYIHTSAVVGIASDLITTKNGHTYRLIGKAVGEEVNPWVL